MANRVWGHFDAQIELPPGFSSTLRVPGKRLESESTWCPVYGLHPEEPQVPVTGWQVDFERAVDRGRISILEKQVASLAREHRTLQEKCKGAGQVSLIVPIQTLAPQPYTVVKEFSVVVQGADDSHIATWFDANVSTSGETQQEAVDNVKDLIIMFYEGLEGMSDDDLGPAMLQQRSVLFEYIRRK